ncbi:hypothetical protein SAY86_019725 [Trapa natans]|uniref:Uncharacterized protein n=1 Tax=Trapa natans TaxID=22666 RepID=A0AAN7M196_TRANT|nr:hypothetical protein SAY86_019725 [Trapa natans]
MKSIGCSLEREIPSDIGTGKAQILDDLGPLLLPEPRPLFLIGLRISSQLMKIPYLSSLINQSGASVPLRSLAPGGSRCFRRLRHCSSLPLSLKNRRSTILVKKLVLSSVDLKCLSSATIQLINSLSSWKDRRVQVQQKAS